MAILNYTTTVDSFKTVSEIEYILMKHKAKLKWLTGYVNILPGYTKRGKGKGIWQ